MADEYTIPSVPVQYLETPGRVAGGGHGGPPIKHATVDGLPVRLTVSTMHLACSEEGKACKACKACRDKVDDELEDDAERLPLAKAEPAEADAPRGQASQGGQGAPGGGGGWEPAPRSRKGAYRREMPGGGYQYWYPGQGAQPEQKGEDGKVTSKARRARDPVHEHHLELEGYNLEVIAQAKGELTEEDIKRAEFVAEKMKKGIPAAADVCQESPPVCEGNLGIPRDQMPQLLDVSLADMRAKAEQEQDPHKRAEAMEKVEAAIAAGADPDDERSIAEQFLDSLEADGVKVSQEEIEVGKLKATQREIKAGKTFGMADAFLKGKFRPQDAEIIVSSDNHILDGHHRWASLVTAAPDVKMKIRRVDIPMAEFLERSFAHPGVFRADLQGEIVDPDEPHFDWSSLKKAIRFWLLRLGEQLDMFGGGPSTPTTTVHRHTRRTRSGKLAPVMEHQRKRRSTRRTGAVRVPSPPPFEAEDVTRPPPERLGTRPSKPRPPPDIDRLMDGDPDERRNALGERRREYAGRIPVTPSEQLEVAADKVDAEAERVRKKREAVAAAIAAKKKKRKRMPEIGSGQLGAYFVGEELDKLGLRNLGTRYGKRGDHYGREGHTLRIRVGPRDTVLEEYVVYAEHGKVKAQWQPLERVSTHDADDSALLAGWAERIEASPQTDTVREAWRAKNLPSAPRGYFP